MAEGWRSAQSSCMIGVRRTKEQLGGILVVREIEQRRAKPANA